MEKEIKDEIKEQIEIVINETKEDNEKIKELSFILNTGIESTITHITEHINGILYAIIIEAEKSVNINISLNDHPDIILFDSNFTGSKYLPLQQEPISSDNQKLNFGTVKWTLNDSLKFIVNNNFNAIVRFTIRYK